MIFNSVTYLLFLTLVLGLYWSLPTRPRLWMIFLASLAFYAFWRVEYTLVMLVSTVTDYLVSLALSKTSDPKRRRRLLYVSLVVNLSLLGYFKYLLFFADNAVGLLNLFGIHATSPAWNIVLPLGISFYTFQTISYTVDVYRGFIEAERDFILYASYVTFFPQLVAGPILRATEVISQLRQRPRFELEQIGIGLRRIAYGLFLKVVLADNIAGVVDTSFSQSVSTLHGIDAWTMAFLFGCQIYFDFSAYSHIAIGSARLMGIRFPENFNFPYLATSPREFWRRWHISLSSWIRDYLYLPLAGEQVYDRSTGGLAKASEPSEKGKTRALFLTWGIMGLWHGAAWTFVIWGLYHAVCVYGHRVLSGRLPKVRGPIGAVIGWAVTLPLMMLGWIPFRARSVHDAFLLMGKALDPRQLGALGLRENTYLICALVMLGILVVWTVKRYVVPQLQRSAGVFMMTETAALTVMIALDFVYLRPIHQFIYFQF